MLGNLGIRLNLLIGKTVPVPASIDLINALTKVEVTNDADSGDGFQLTFVMSKGRLLEYNLIQNGSVDPFTRVIISVSVGVIPEVLIDGIITHHQINPNGDQGNPTITVSGKDVSLMMDLRERNDEYKNQPDSLIVTNIIKSYSEYGLVPQPTPTVIIPLETERITKQQETDLKFIQKLAERNGFIFFVEPVSIGVNKAYWGPANRTGFPQPALTLNMGSYTNLSSINFSYDSLAPVGTEGTFIEPFTKTRIPIPVLPSLKFPPLCLYPTQPKKTVLLRDTANQDAAQAANNSVSAMTNTPDSVNGDGEIDTIKYGHILRARNLVGVRGVGISYDGLYYVKKVSHSISQGVYKQQFSISREGLVSLTPVLEI